MTTEELRKIILRVASALKRTHNFDVNLKDIVDKGEGNFTVYISANGRAADMSF